MKEEKKNLIILVVIIGLMLLVTGGVWAAASFWPSKKIAAGDVPVTPVPTATASPRLSPSPVLAVLEPEEDPSPSPSRPPSPKPSPSSSNSPTPKPSVLPSPTVSPSPSPSPSPTADVDLNVEKAIFSLNQCQDGSTTINITHESTTYEYPSSSNYCVGKIEIRNNGHQAASNFEVKILINSEVKANTTVDKIEAGSAKTLDLKYTLPSTTGQFTVKVQANPDHKIGESRFDNNEVSMNLKIT